MGFDIQRFVDQNIDQELICNICQDVLEEPLMIASCQHLYCGKCIRDCIRVHGICPQDRSPVSISKLVEPIRFVKNLLNKLKIRCKTSSGGCDLIVCLGELNKHLDSCEANPENIEKKCFCKKSFSLEEFNSHKELCLEYQKNKLNIAKSQVSTLASTSLQLSDALAAKVTTDSEIKFLYKHLKQSLPSSSSQYNSLQNSLIFICGKLLNHELETEKDLLTTVRYVKYGFEDISLSTKHHYDNCCDFLSLNGFDYVFWCHQTFNNKHINKFFAQIVKNLSEFEDLLIEVMNKRVIKMILSLMTEKNDINTCIDSATVITAIVLKGSDLWDEHLPDFNRQNMLRLFKSHLSKWKVNQKPDLDIDSFKEMFDKMRSDSTPQEIKGFYIWLITYAIKTNPEKYIPIIESDNGFQYLRSLSESEDIESYSQRNLELILNKWMEWEEKRTNIK